MPTVKPVDLMMRHLSTCNKAAIAALPVSGGKYPLPIGQLIQQITSDRLKLAGEKLRAGDGLIFTKEFRSAISRHYYAMYHAARAIVFAEEQGDDYSWHSVLPRHLPTKLPDVTTREQELIDARLLRNEADYDIYPPESLEWQYDARRLMITAANFVTACDDFALTNGYI